MYSYSATCSLTCPDSPQKVWYAAVDLQIECCSFQIELIFQEFIIPVVFLSCFFLVITLLTRRERSVLNSYSVFSSVQSWHKCFVSHRNCSCILTHVATQGVLLANSFLFCVVSSQIPTLTRTQSLLVAEKIGWKNCGLVERGNWLLITIIGKTDLALRNLI